MVRTIAIAAAVLLVALLAFVATRPDSFDVARSTSIHAPPEKIFPLIDDLHAWGAWSPYERRDPNMKKTYSGSARGKGTVYEWSGNRDVGSGRMEIIESDPPSQVTLDLHFLEPFESRSTARFALTREADGTRVTWALHGPNSFMGKLMSLFFSTDDLVGKDFESGLAELKAIAER